MESVIFEEEWKPVVGYEGVYEVSNMGRVKRLAGTNRTPVERILKPSVSLTGIPYLSVFLCKDGRKKRFYIHRLVLEAFVGKAAEGKEAAHNDGDPSNNKLSNLRWDTAQGNAADRAKHGTERYGEQKANSKLTEKTVSFIRKHPEIPGVELAELFDVSCKTISFVRNYRSWNGVIAKCEEFDKNSPM